MQTLTANLLNNMTYISIAIIVAMVVIFFIGVINNLMLKSSYSKIIKELDSINNDGMEVYNNKMLNEIVSSYKEAYLKSYDGVNTQAIIESKFYKMNKNKIGKESFLNNLNAMLLTLGIVGTLYNIIVIVINLASMFKSVDAKEIVSMTSVLGDVSTIIAYMGIAFATTFIAIVLSFIYQVVNSMTHIEVERTNLFSRIEDYLDNSLGANLSKQKPQMLPNEGYSNANMLYAIKNTSDSMMKTTMALEETISKLNNSLKGIAEKNQNLLSSNNKSEIDELYSDEEEFEGYEQLRLERLKQIEESKKIIEQNATEKLESLKNGDVIPNKDKVYVKEVEITKPEFEQLTKQDVNKEVANEKAKEVLEQIKKDNEINIKEIQMNAPQTPNVIPSAPQAVQAVPVMVDTDDTPMPKVPDAKEYISESEKKFFEEHDAKKVLNELNNEKEEEKISSNDLENSIKDEVRKLDNILSAEENVSASNNNSKVPSNDAIKALTSEDIESLKRELIRRQEEERRIREISESRKQENN
ncbi:MAG: hypothetical protein MJ245_01025 [Clostridia bacterium]|nr:hypothetical protein [Clostridia bacterium]